MLTRVDRRRALGVHRSAAPLSRAAFLCSGAAAHPPWAEFVDGSHPQGAWRKGTDGQQRLMLYSIENDGLRTRYWIIAEGERIQVPPYHPKRYRSTPITDRPRCRCLRHYNGHPLVRCFIRGPEG